MRLSQRLSLAMGVLTLLIACSVGFAIFEMSKISNEAIQIRSKDVPNVVRALQLDTLASDSTMNTIRYVTAKDPAEALMREQRITDLRKRSLELQSAYAVNITTPDDRQLWASYQSSFNKLAELRERAMALAKEKKAEEALKALDGPYVDTYYVMATALKKVVDYNLRNVDTSLEGTADIIDNSNTLLSILLVVAILIASGVALLIIRTVMGQLGKDPGVLVSIARRVSTGDYNIDDGTARTGVYGNIVHMVEVLKENIDKARRESEKAQEESANAQKAQETAEAAGKQAQSKTAAMLSAALKLEEIAQVVSSASTQLAAQIEQSERGAAQQAARVAETATAMEEMNSTVLEVARNAGTASETSTATRKHAEQGSKVVLQSIKSIRQVQDQALKLKTDMTQLDESAKAISQIMGVISDIADQTNLLALNAAIEAARAGEAGRGFAVVADEVRKLAEKTMASTTDVGNTIRSIQQSVAESIAQVDASASAIEEATLYANQSGEALNTIVHMMEGTADQVRAIATASEEQSATSEEINRSLHQVNSIATETARAMAEAAVAVSDLASQSHVLTGLIADMKHS